MDLIAEIRRRHLVNKENISSIARDLKLSRPTVRKHLKTESEPVYERQQQPLPKLGAFCHVDGRNSNTALLVESYANTIFNDYALAWSAAHGAAAMPAVVDFRTRYNPTLTSRWFIVPGIVALLTMVVTLLVVALSVAREREMGTFDQLLVTPLRQIEILLGKGLPGLLIGGIEASVIILAAVFWFHVPLRGHLLLLYAGVLLFVLAITGIGLAISALVATQQQALLGAFLFIVPAVILSGFATPIANMPELIQYLTLLNPMRYFLIIAK